LEANLNGSNVYDGWTMRDSLSRQQLTARTEGESKDVRWKDRTTFEAGTGVSAYTVKLSDDDNHLKEVMHSLIRSVKLFSKYLSPIIAYTFNVFILLNIIMLIQH
jgi:hypothetical protein